MIKKFGIILLLTIIAAAASASPYDKILVKPTPIQAKELFDRFTAIGQCKNEQSRNYYAMADGRVDFVSIQEGDKVKAGDIILAIDQELAVATKNQANAALKLAESAYERSKNLFAKKFISQQALDTARGKFEEARQASAQGNKIHNDLLIKAPFDGEIGVVKARVGNRVKVGEYLFDIVATSNKTIIAELPEPLYGKVFNGNEVIITDTNGNVCKGRVSAISSYLSDSGTISVKIIVDKDNKLIHGSFVSAEFIINKHQALSLPEQTILKNEKGNFIYRIDDKNIVKQVYIHLGTRTDGAIEITSPDIKAGDLVVLEGLTKVTDGAQVELEKDGG